MTDNRVRFLKAADGSVDRSRIGGYLVRYGSEQRKDLQGEYFTPETDYGLDWYDRRPLLYHHGMDTTMRDRVIGVIDTMKADDTGIWVEAQLELANEYVQAVLELVDKGALGWSSGALGYLVEYGRNGEIKKWPIVEGSLTPTPADPATFGDVNYQNAPDVRTVGGGYVYDVDAARAAMAYKSIGLDVPKLLLDVADEGDAEQEQKGASGADRAIVAKVAHDDKKQASARKDAHDDKKEMEMSEQAKRNEQALDPAAIAEVVEQVLSKREEERELAEMKAKAEEAEALRKELEALKAQAKAEPAKRLPGSTEEPDVSGVGVKAAAIEVGDKYDHLSALDMALGVALKGLVKPDEHYMRALAHKAAEAKLVVKRGGAPVKADELMHTSNTGYGAEWIATMWSNQLWRDAIDGNPVLSLFNQIDMPSNPYELPTSGSDATAYLVPETEDETQLTYGSGNTIPDSKVGTAKVTLTAKKIGVRVPVSAEMLEDSIVAALPEINQSVMYALQQAIENAILNGDTETGATGNINSDDAAPPSTAVYLAFDGLRKLPLVTNTANAVDAAAAPSMALLRSVRALLPSRYAYNPANLAWVVDWSTYNKLLGLTEVSTVDKYGPNATVLTGELARVDGIPVIVSPHMPLTQADGKVDTLLTNDKGQMVLVYRPGWRVGFRRQVKIVSEFFGALDAWQITGTLRLALARFNTEASAALYNITV